MNEYYIQYINILCIKYEKYKTGGSKTININ